MTSASGYSQHTNANKLINRHVIPLVTLVAEAVTTADVAGDADEEVVDEPVVDTTLDDSELDSAAAVDETSMTVLVKVTAAPPEVIVWPSYTAVEPVVGIVEVTVVPL
jgi:hypothetical protein